MGIREQFTRGAAGQLARPSGIIGRAVARMMNRGNGGVIRAAIDLAAIEPEQRAADFGFGGGLGLRLLLERVGPFGRVTGIDAAADVVARANRVFQDPITLGRLTVMVGSLQALPLPDASIDAAITVNTLYFVQDVEVVFAELRRVLRPGGRLVVAIGDAEAMARLPFTPYGFTLRAAADVRSALESAGFTGVEDHRVGTGPGASHLLLAPA